MEERIKELEREAAQMREMIVSLLSMVASLMMLMVKPKGIDP